MQAYKPGSVHFPSDKHLSDVKLLVIYLVPVSRPESIDPPTLISSPGWQELDLNEQLFNQGLFDLSTHKVCPAMPVTRHPVGSYPTISPLPGFNETGRYIFCGTVCDRNVSVTAPSC